ncbi:MAG: hypothetical protein ACTSU5_21550 [Promethearchaeota archaeon]
MPKLRRSRGKKAQGKPGPVEEAAVGGETGWRVPPVSGDIPEPGKAGGEEAGTKGAGAKKGGAKKGSGEKDGAKKDSGEKGGAKKDSGEKDGAKKDSGEDEGVRAPSPDEGKAKGRALKRWRPKRASGGSVSAVISGELEPPEMKKVSREIRRIEAPPADAGAGGLAGTGEAPLEEKTPEEAAALPDWADEDLQLAQTYMEGLDSPLVLQEGTSAAPGSPWGIPPEHYYQKILEYGFTTVDVHLPTLDLARELEAFPEVDARQRAGILTFLETKPDVAKQRFLVLLQYLALANKF